MSQPNFPAISDPGAMRNYPHARRLERDALIGLATLRPGMRVLDIQAAGGYLADRVYEMLAGEVRCVCLEPCVELASRINPVHEVCLDPMERMEHIPSRSIDLALGLAGFHHSNNLDATARETWRVLKAGGEIAVCDVIKGSKMAVWLNDFVDQHNPAGHRGTFLAQGEMTGVLARANFEDITEEVRQVPWLFETEADLARFCKGLFNLAPSEAEVGKAIHRYLDVTPTAEGLSLAWQLTYARGIKNAT